MKKKVLAVLLGGCMVAGLLAGCGGGGDDAKTSDDGSKDSGKSGGYNFEVVVKSFQSTYWQAAKQGIDTASKELGVKCNTTGPNAESDIADQVNMLNNAINFQSTYWQAAKQGIDTASKELGVKCNTTGPNAESDIADQVNMLNNAINKAPDGIALAACDQSSVLKSLQTALDKKIPVVCFDTGVADAPEGSVYATVVTNNEEAGGIAAEKMYEALKDQLANAKDTVRIGEVNQDAEGSVYATVVTNNEEAGGIAAEKMYEALKDQLANAKDTVRIGEVNQDATSGNITGRGMGFINKFKELAEADGKKVAVVGNEYYVNLVENNAKEADADIIIEVAVPAQTTVELSATEASNIMNKKDTIAMFGSNQVTAEGLLTAMFGSNQVTAEGLLTANQNLDVLGTGEGKILGVGFDAGSTQKGAVKDGTLLGSVTQAPVDQGRIAIETLNGTGEGKILGVGFDAGSTQKGAVKDGTLLGSVTQAPVDQGRIAIETLNNICEGKEVKDVETACYWDDAETMEDAEIAPNLYD